LKAAQDEDLWKDTKTVVLEVARETNNSIKSQKKKKWISDKTFAACCCQMVFANINCKKNNNNCKLYKLESAVLNFCQFDASYNELVRQNALQKAVGFLRCFLVLRGSCVTYYDISYQVCRIVEYSILLSKV